MSLELHENADEHAPFKHYVVPYEYREITGKREGKKVFEVKETGVHVICYYCGHWVERPLKNCTCIASCHIETLASVS